MGIGSAPAGGGSENFDPARKRWRRPELVVDIGAVRLPRFRRLLAGTSISSMGEWASLVSIPAAVEALNGSDLALALILGSYFVTVSLMAIIGGGLGDRYSRRHVMIAADLFSLAAQGTCALLFLTGSANLWLLGVTQLFLGVATGLFQPQLNGVTSEYVADPDHRQGANSIRGIFQALGQTLGPAAGVVLITSLSVGAAFAFDALTFLASALILRSIGRMKEPTPSVIQSEQEAERGTGLELAAGWRAFRGMSWLVVVMVTASILNAFAIGPFQVLGAAATEVGGGSVAWAMVLAGLGLGAVLGGGLGLIWKPDRPLRAGYIGMGFWAGPMLLFAVSAPAPLIALAAAPAGGANIFFNAVWETSVQNHVPDNLMSRVTSFDTLGSFALIPIGIYAAAASVDAIGPHVSFRITAAIVLAGVSGALCFKSVRDLRAKSDPQPQGEEAEPEGVAGDSLGRLDPAPSTSR